MLRSMRKRQVVVVSSSDDEEDDCSMGAACSSSKSKSERSIAWKKCKGSKKAFILDAKLCKDSNKVEQVSFDALFEDLYDDLHGNQQKKDLHGFHMVPGQRDRRNELNPQWKDKKDLWVDKYRPSSIRELAVHKKKIEEVKMWLEERVRPSKFQEPLCGHALVITGKAGVGKSATIHAIASHLGAEVCEWKTPTPTLWQEYTHNANSGINYMSKLDEFETFVERVRKYSLLTSVSKDGSKKAVILLIDDLPVTNGRIAHGRLSKCLHVLAQSTQIPTVISITECGKTDSGDSTNYSEALLLSLERAGAFKVAFNPLTVNSIKKTLSRICKEEHSKVSSEWIDHIAKTSGGDIRHAITSLQYFCLRPDVMLSVPLSALSISQLIEKSDEHNEVPLSSVSFEEDLNPLLFGRDETLTLFHALGKFLHNKRETSDDSAFEKDHFILKNRYKRFPLKMDSPETVLCQAHGHAGPIADFLHENVLDFLCDEAIDDAWIVASYLSDADCLLSNSLNRSGWSRMMTGKHEPENVACLVSASVAVRGVLFGNSHPSPSRWHSIRSPKLWQVEQSSRHNKNRLVLDKFKVCSSFGSLPLSVMAMDYKPIFKCLGYEGSDILQDCKKPMTHAKVKVDHSDWMDQDEMQSDHSGESEEDDIEDW